MILFLHLQISHLRHQRRIASTLLSPLFTTYIIYYIVAALYVDEYLYSVYYLLFKYVCAKGVVNKIGTFFKKIICIIVIL